MSTGKRWHQRDEDALREIRHRLREQLAAYPPFPDVVGDRHMLRYIRGKMYDLDEACRMFAETLKWREENGVDKIRHDILYNGINSPLKFPKGETIINLAPQIVVAANALDKFGRPLVLEQYCFNPKDVFDSVTIDEYLQFLIYSLEYRALVLEQLSHEREKEYVTANPNPADRGVGYGVVLMDFVIRDLRGVGIGHLSGKGRQIIEAALKIGMPHYPEYMGKTHMINVPWVFNSLWYFIKGLLDENTLSKINLCGSKYMDALLKDIPMSSIPSRLGGVYDDSRDEVFHFDVTPAGPFHVSDARSGIEASPLCDSPSSRCRLGTEYGASSPITSLVPGSQRVGERSPEKAAEAAQFDFSDEESDNSSDRHSVSMGRKATVDNDIDVIADRNAAVSDSDRIKMELVSQPTVSDLDYDPTFEVQSPTSATTVPIYDSTRNRNSTISYRSPIPLSPMQLKPEEESMTSSIPMELLTDIWKKLRIEMEKLHEYFFQKMPSLPDLFMETFLESELSAFLTFVAIFLFVMQPIQFTKLVLLPGSFYLFTLHYI